MMFVLFLICGAAYGKLTSSVTGFHAFQVGLTLIIFEGGGVEGGKWGWGCVWGEKWGKGECSGNTLRFGWIR